MTMSDPNLLAKFRPVQPVRTIVPYGPSVVYAPPAFKGQKSARGATKARFAYIAERLAKAQTK